MPSTNRRAFIAATTAALATTTAGCSVLAPSNRAAHTVSVYLGDREATREVTVSITDETGEVVFERDYRLDDANEADENATFPVANEPATVLVTVDGVPFERDWPGVETEGLPCQGDNRAGIEIWIEGGPDEAPDVRFETNCQHVTTT